MTDEETDIDLLPKYDPAYLVSIHQRESRVLPNGDLYAEFDVTLREDLIPK